MSIIVFQHTPSEHAGRLNATIRDHGRRLDVRRLDLPMGGPSNNRHVPPDFDDVDGVITLGGAMNLSDGLAWMEPQMAFLRGAHARSLPVIGVCLGAQLIAKALGGEVGPMEDEGEGGAEWGMGQVRQHAVANTDTILAGVPWTAWQFHAHGQEVKTPPPGATVLQYSPKCQVQSFRAGLRTYAFQYHFECDMPMIEEFFRPGGGGGGGEDGGLMGMAGVTARGGLEEARARYEDYARASSRLCMNLATYLLSVSRKIVA